MGTAGWPASAVLLMISLVAHADQHLRADRLRLCGAGGATSVQRRYGGRGERRHHLPAHRHLVRHHVPAAGGDDLHADVHVWALSVHRRTESGDPAHDRAVGAVGLPRAPDRRLDRPLIRGGKTAAGWRRATSASNAPDSGSADSVRREDNGGREG